MKKLSLIIFYFICTYFCYGQHLEIANKYYNEYSYLKASKLYEEALKKGDTTATILTNLGNCYYNNSKTEEAIKWYELLYKKFPNENLSTKYQFIQSLRSVGNYKKADSIQNALSKLYTNDSRLKEVNESTKTYYLNRNPLNIFTLKPVNINTKRSEFGSFIHKGFIYFSSPDKESKKRYNWNQEPFLDLYRGKFNKKTKKITDVTLLNENINTPYHEGTIAITKDGSTMYFTRDVLNERKRVVQDTSGTVNLNIYKSKNINGEWQTPTVLPFCSINFSTGHPTLSPDEKRLYFASDRPGGFGNTDIFYVDILSEDTYGEPVNLGTNINTEGSELFPFVSKNNELYFSSNGRLGLGLLDIYMSKYDSITSQFENVKHLEEPLNSKKDDFAFFIDSESPSDGLFSTNRNSRTNDDIYTFHVEECTEFISGKITDAKTNKSIEASIRLLNKSGKVLDSTETSNGKYKLTVPCDDTYKIVANKKDYLPNSKEITIAFDHKKNNVLDLELTPLIIENKIVINPIYFDFDKWDIRTDAAVELESIVRVMNDNPNMIITIESHTDCRGPATYNEKLSDKRAKSTRDYLYSRGIAVERIQSAIGFGENQLLHTCNNKCSSCTEDEHQLNRRSVFNIIKK